MTLFLRYLNVYKLVLRINLQKFFAYRLNAFVRSIYSPIYFLAQYFTAYFIFENTPSLGGWSRDEGLLLALVATAIYAISFMLFWGGGIIEFMWNLVRNGKLDQYLTKPMSIQFLVFFTKPSFDMLLSVLLNAIMIVYHIQHSSLEISAAHMLQFLILCVLNLVVVYLALATIATISFYVTRAEQIEQMLNKASDFAQYPMSIFPKSLQAAAFSFMLFAYMGYTQTAVLVGKGELWHWQATLLALIVFGVLYKISWKYGLRYYTSASS